jgi:hypothetical protein
MKKLCASGAWLLACVCVVSCAGPSSSPSDAGVTTSDAGTPTLVPDPVACTFGRLAVGAVGTCDLTLQNAGATDALITSVGFDLDTDPRVFAIASSDPLGNVVVPGHTTRLQLIARPIDARALTGHFVVTLNDAASANVIVPLTVTGALPPIACARVKSINGVDNTSATPVLHVGDDVVITGDCSTPSSLTSPLAAYRWRMDASDEPAASTAFVSSPTVEDTRFTCNGGHGVDVAGTYTLHLIVSDRDGVTSTNDAHLTLSVVPADGAGGP